MEELQERRVRHAALGAEIHAAFANRAHSGLQSILQTSAEALVKRLDAAFVRIWMLSGPENLLELQASAGQYTRLNGEFAQMRVGERHVGFVAQQRKPYIVNDLVNDARTTHREWAKQELDRPLAGYPVLVEGHLVGVLAMFARQILGIGHSRSARVGGRYRRSGCQAQADRSEARCAPETVGGGPTPRMPRQLELEPPDRCPDMVGRALPYF